MYENLMDKFSRELLKIISERYNEGKPELIRSDVVRLQKKFGIGFEEAEAARKRFEKKLMDEWVNSKTKEKDSKIKNTGADNNADGAFAKIKGKVNRDIKRTIDRALKRKLSQAETQKLLKRILNGIKADAATIGRTARMGKIRSDFIIKSLQNGITYFRFAGPTGASRTMDRARDFCLRHLGKVFSIEEILALDNGQGLPVLIYMGGYNCRHWWEAVPGKVEGGVFIHEEWQIAYDKANNTDRKILKRELENCKKIKVYKPKWDIQMIIKKASNGGLVDALINRRDAEFKNPSSKSKHVLNNNLKEAKEQSDDIYIFINSDIAEYDVQIRKAETWLLRHPKKRLFIIDELKNEIYEVGNENPK